MDLWSPACKSAMQSLQRQLNAQARAERPTADDPGEDIHQDRQVNERPVAEADVCDVSDPDLIGPYDIEFLDQILVARERVARISSLFLDRLAPQFQAHLAEHSPHALAPDGLELAVLAPQLMGDPPRAVGRELSGDLLDRAVIPTATRQS